MPAPMASYVSGVATAGSSGASVSGKLMFSFPWDPWDWHVYLHLVDFYGRCR